MRLHKQLCYARDVHHERFVAHGFLLVVTKPGV